MMAVMDREVGVRKVLVVDDQEDVREALRLLLKGSGYRTEEESSPNAALAKAAYGDHDLIIVDMNYTWDTTSGDEGLRLLDRLRAQRPEVPVIAMTGWSTIELAVEAMHHGACDFIPKPWDNRHFLSVVKKHIEARHEERRPLGCRTGNCPKGAADSIARSSFFHVRAGVRVRLTSSGRGQWRFVRLFSHRRPDHGVCRRRCVR